MARLADATPSQRTAFFVAMALTGVMIAMSILSSRFSPPLARMIDPVRAWPATGVLALGSGVLLVAGAGFGVLSVRALRRRAGFVPTLAPGLLTLASAIVGLRILSLGGTHLS